MINWVFLIEKLLGLCHIKILVYLEDKNNNSMKDIRLQSTYTYQPTATEENNRFVLHLSLNNTSIGSEQNNGLNTTSVYTYDNCVYIDLSEEKALVKIYNVLGQELMNKEIKTGLNKFNMDLSSGTYLVSVISGGDVRTEKVYLK